jgi:hypothetical protein
MIWYKLESVDRSAAIHFGYDFYLYVRGMSVSPRARDVATTNGIFIEPFQSPYATGEGLR